MTRKARSSARSFRRLLREFERVQKIQLEDLDCCQGLTLAQCHPLLEIDDLGETTTRDLADRLGLDKSTLSRTIDTLVRRGLVRRGTARTDRRFVPLTLTAEGRRICEEIHRKNDAHYDDVLRRIPDEDRSELLRLFGALVNAMASACDVAAGSLAGSPTPARCCERQDDGGAGDRARGRQS